MNKRYTQEELKFLSDFYPSKGAKFCADTLDRPINSIKTICHKHNIKLLHSTWCKLAEESKFKKNDQFKVDVENFYTITSPEMAYILGLLWGDGYLYKKYRIELGCVLSDADYFYTIFKKTGDWNFTQKISKNKNDKIQGVIQTSNKNIVMFLEANDYRIKSGVSADKILNLIPTHLQKYFFIGLTDADGSFYYNRKTGHTNQFTIYSTYNQDWSYIENLYKSLNITYKISRIVSKKSKSSMIRITGYTNIQKYGDFIYDTYELDEIGLLRKYKVYKEITDRNKHVGLRVIRSRSTLNKTA